MKSIDGGAQGTALCRFRPRTVMTYTYKRTRGQSTLNLNLAFSCRTSTLS